LQHCCFLSTFSQIVIDIFDDKRYYLYNDTIQRQRLARKHTLQPYKGFRACCLHKGAEMKKWLITLILLISLCGCTKELNTETGEATWRLNPIISEQIENTAEGTAGLLQALAPIVPYAGTAGAALLAALGIYRGKVKPNYVKAKTEAELYHASTKTLVDVIEDIKKNQPELWLKLKPALVDSQMAKNVEQVIWALKQEKPNI